MILCAAAVGICAAVLFQTTESATPTADAVGRQFASVSTTASPPTGGQGEGTGGWPPPVAHPAPAEADMTAATRKAHPPSDPAGTFRIHPGTGPATAAETPAMVAERGMIKTQAAARTAMARETAMVEAAALAMAVETAAGTGTAEGEVAAARLSGCSGFADFRPGRNPAGASFVTEASS